MTTSNGGETILCPSKVDREVSILAASALYEGRDMPDAAETQRVLAETAVCDCVLGPQRRRIVGIELPGLLGKTCGRPS
jgi:hypothetical protein